MGLLPLSRQVVLLQPDDEAPALRVEALDDLPPTGRLAPVMMRILYHLVKP